MSSWDDLALEFQREAEEIFRATGEIILVAATDDSPAGLILASKTRLLKVSQVVGYDFRTKRDAGTDIWRSHVPNFSRFVRFSSSSLGDSVRTVSTGLGRSTGTNSFSRLEIMMPGSS
jgi:hypothetical protein